MILFCGYSGYDYSLQNYFAALESSLTPRFERLGKMHWQRLFIINKFGGGFEDETSKYWIKLLLIGYFHPCADFYHSGAKNLQ